MTPIPMMSEKFLSCEQLQSLLLDKLEIDGDEYDRLYDYYLTEADTRMPYGTAKARDGDPHQWIEAQVLTDMTEATGLSHDDLILAARSYSPEEFAFFVGHEVLHRKALALGRPN